jgi:hypothetical protein
MEAPQPLPTRVIALDTKDPPQRAFLLETQGTKGKYVALSYCWGKSQAFTTTRETYEARTEGFSIASLPKTIRDALLATWQIGLSFIWIDAICIIQGDSGDWERESSKMAEVYGNAEITISAATSPDANSGCLERSWSANKSPVAIKSRCSGTAGTGTMFLSPKVGSINDALYRSILNSRGWCLQERILSRRVIHFTKEQLYWECQRSTITEDGMSIEDTNELKRCLSSSRSEESNALWSRSMRSWHRIVSEYCLRDLSHLSDKLPAISGLAKIIHQRTGARYLAGLWLQDLPLALLWRCQPENEKGGPASTWRAPSWTWASIDGAVDSQGYRPSASLLSGLLEEAGILAHSITLGSSNPFGQVTAGHLKIRARRRLGRRGGDVTQYDYGGWTGNLDSAYPVANEGGEHIGEVFFDARNGTPPVDFDCLLIRSGMTKGNDRSSYFLAITSVPHSGCYTRLGVGTIWKDRYFASADIVEVKLV